MKTALSQKSIHLGRGTRLLSASIKVSQLAADQHRILPKYPYQNAVQSAAFITQIHSTFEALILTNNTLINKLPWHHFRIGRLVKGILKKHTGTVLSACVQLPVSAQFHVILPTVQLAAIATSECEKITRPHANQQHGRLALTKWTLGSFVLIKQDKSHWRLSV